MKTSQTGFQSHFDYLRSSLSDIQSESALLAVSGYLNLPPFLKALLVADGTVTLLLRAYFGEEILVNTQRQGMERMPFELPIIGLKSGEEVFVRQVELAGCESGKSYARATSLINPSLLADELFSALIDEHVGMGEVLRNSARGSFREVLHVCDAGEAWMRRTYAVFLSQRPAILITEDFQVALFE